MTLLITNEGIDILQNNIVLDRVDQNIHVDTSEIINAHTYMFSVKIGDLPFQQVKNGKINISQLKDFGESVIIKVKIVDLQSNTTVSVIEKEFTIAHFIGIGEFPQNPYQPLLQHLINRIEVLEIAVAKKLKEGDIE